MVLIALMLLLLFSVGGWVGVFFSYHNHVFICTSGFGACLVVVLTALAFLLFCCCWLHSVLIVQPQSQSSVSL